MNTARRAGDDAASTAFEFSATCAAEPHNVAPLRSALRRWLAAHHIDRDHAFAIVIATGEAIANAVEHAYANTAQVGSLSLRARRDRSGISIEVEDHGSWKPAVSHDERGRGLVLMRALGSRLDVERMPSRTLLRLYFALGGGVANTERDSELRDEAS